ncbi:ABC-type Fe3+-siderophore transport system, permease 2 component [Acidisarcina polymorpha]|uniref:ABC-type Fe3+-siderophore transport system, permease 2 component n=1 Tax=Acidisarcina polymorpha TaxID=2211140 RepID=A0A2Z5G4U5_9BACT|nr:iron ABC transporter permease [Acidisarcina polymorpha]AXC13990.1 ABC-type Fe3+-siderophore transport system, permease 2 component [Acidisarcina polymorpha]
MRDRPLNHLYQHEKQLLKFVGLGGLVLLLAVAAALVGYYPVHLRDLTSAALHTQNADPLATYVILVLRLPRLLAALSVGAAMALAGSVTQSLLQNPLAEPSVLGISAGASFMALFSLTVLHISQTLLPLAAFLGALGTGVAVMSLARGFRRREALDYNSMRLVLSGVMVSVVFSAGTLAVVNYGQMFQLNEVMRWTTGSLADVGWGRAWPILVILPLLMPVVLLSARTLRVHTMGEERARSLGAHAARERGWLLLTSAALVGTAVAVAGPVAFIGLLVPNIMRRWHGTMSVSSLLQSGMLGGALVLGADLLGRSIVAPLEIPYGLITIILGAPYLLYFLIRRRRIA